MNRRHALGALVAGASGLAVPRAARANAAVRVAEQPIDASLEVSYAQAHGFAAAEGLDVDVTILPSNGSANLAAMAGGSVDVAIANTFSALSAFERGVPLTVVAPSTVYDARHPSSFLMVRKDSPVRTARDLNGKTIAVDGLRNITQYGPMAWVDKNGGDAATLQFVEMPFADMGLALASRRVDAAVLAEPFASRAVESRPLAGAFDGIAPSFLISVWVATRTWAAAHPDTARAFARMVYRTAQWANRHRDATAETLERVTHVDPATLATLVRATYCERYDRALVQPVIDVALKYGALARSLRPEDLIAPAMPVRA